jgi:thiol-disulfide isomerase/thioredoxin
MHTFMKLSSALVFCTAPALMAGVVLQPTPAPDWEVSAWLNDDPGALRDHRGQVVVIGFFQLWCPVSREFSIPLLQRWRALYGDREDVVVIFLHSAFEGHDYQSPQRLRKFIRDNGILLPVGLDAYDDADKQVPVTMRRYEAGGSPHLVIVDKDGMLRFTHFGMFTPEPIEAFIERLLEEPAGSFGRMFAAAPRTEQVRPEVDTTLSGAYLFKTDRATGLCASLIPSMEVPAELRVYRDMIDIDFIEPLLGMGALEVAYDVETGRVEGGSDRAAAVQGSSVTNQDMRLEGVLDGDAQPPELEFELSLLDGKCAVEGRARGEP